MTNDKRNHEYWMRLALKEAEAAMKLGEIPVATILVAGDNEIGRGQTQVKRRESIAAHGELFTLLEAKHLVFSAPRPLVLYTTLEPCVMCLGAAMQTGIDEIVFGMDATPDGGCRYAEDFGKRGQNAPKITSHVLEQEQVKLMQNFATRFPESPAIPYVRALLEPYK